MEWGLSRLSGPLRSKVGQGGSGCPKLTELLLQGLEQGKIGAPLPLQGGFQKTLLEYSLSVSRYCGNEDEENKANNNQQFFSLLTLCPGTDLAQVDMTPCSNTSGHKGLERRQPKSRFGQLSFLLGKLADL